MIFFVDINDIKAEPILFCLLVYVIVFYGAGILHAIYLNFVDEYTIRYDDVNTDAGDKKSISRNRGIVDLVIQQDWQSVFELMSFGFQININQLDDELLVLFVEKFILQPQYKSNVVINVELLENLVDRLYTESRHYDHVHEKPGTTQNNNDNINAVSRDRDSQNEKSYNNDHLWWLRLLVNIIRIYSNVLKLNMTELEQFFGDYLKEYWIEPLKIGMYLLEIAQIIHNKDVNVNHSTNMNRNELSSIHTTFVAHVLEKIWNDDSTPIAMNSSSINIVDDDNKIADDEPSITIEVFLSWYDITGHSKLIDTAITDNKIDTKFIYNKLCEICDSKPKLISGSDILQQQSLVSETRQFTQQITQMIRLFGVINQCFGAVEPRDVDSRKQIIVNTASQAITQYTKRYNYSQILPIDCLEIMILSLHALECLQSCVNNDNINYDHDDGNLGNLADIKCDTDAKSNNQSENNFLECVDVVTRRILQLIKETKITSLIELDKVKKIDCLVRRMKLLDQDNYYQHWMPYLVDMAEKEADELDVTFFRQKLIRMVTIWANAKEVEIPLSFYSLCVELKLWQDVFKSRISKYPLCDEHTIIAAWNNYCNYKHFDKEILFELGCSMICIKQDVIHNTIFINENIPLIHYVSHLFPCGFVENVWNMIINNINIDVNGDELLNKMLTFRDKNNQNLFHYIAMRNHYGYIEQKTSDEREKESVLVWNFICTEIKKHNICDLNDLWSQKSDCALVCNTMVVCFGDFFFGVDVCVLVTFVFSILYFFFIFKYVLLYK